MDQQEDVKPDRNVEVPEYQRLVEPGRGRVVLVGLVILHLLTLVLLVMAKDF